jgi:hypothetical protein
MNLVLVESWFVTLMSTPMYLTFLCERKLAASFPFLFFSVVPMVTGRTERELLENPKGGCRSIGSYWSYGSKLNIFIKVRESFTLLSLSLFQQIREPGCSYQKTHTFRLSYKKKLQKGISRCLLKITLSPRLMMWHPWCDYISKDIISCKFKFQIQSC